MSSSSPERGTTMEYCGTGGNYTAQLFHNGKGVCPAVGGEVKGRLPALSGGPLSITRLKADKQTRSGRFRQTFQRSHGRTGSPAFQAGNHRLSCPHPSSQFLLGKPSAAAHIHYRRSQDKLFFKCLIGPAILRLLHPLLMHL